MPGIEKKSCVSAFQRWELYCGIPCYDTIINSCRYMGKASCGGAEMKSKLVKYMTPMHTIAENPIGRIVYVSCEGNGDKQEKNNAD